MSTNKDTTNIELKFNEFQAYEELRMIFVIAIETQDFSTIETRIAAWEKKYPLAEFQDPEIIRRIKAILNKDFLSRLIGDYLAAKILHEQEKQRQLYDDLKAIIDNAKKTKDFKSAQKEIRKWKANLEANGFTLYSFDRYYRARVCTLLLLPSKELKNQEEATDELRKLKENGSSMNSEEYFNAISAWQNKYSIPDFPEKLQKELNQMTAEVFDSISQKRTCENAISEIETVLSSKDEQLPFNRIAIILSKYDYKSFPQDARTTIERLYMEALSIQASILDNGISGVDLSAFANISPTEVNALASLRDIINHSPHDMDTILNWIYINRKLDFSEFARNEILKQFSSVGYIVQPQSSYSIPEINLNLNNGGYSKVDDLRKSVILNYLGIISQGNKLSIIGKDNLMDAHAVSEQKAIVKDTPQMYLEAFDTIIEQPEAEKEKLYNEKGEVIVAQEEESIYNIFAEVLMAEPLATYSIPTTSSPIIETTSEVDNSTTATTSPEFETIDNLAKEPEMPTTSSHENPETQYTLTVDDCENIEQAQDLSTYFIVSSPILEQLLTPKQKRKQPKTKDIIQEL